MRRPLITLVVLSLGLLAMLVAGCDWGKVDPRGQRIGVRGTVTLDGKPLDRARITFRPTTGHATVIATGSIVDGRYEIPEKHGPLIGTMRVEIEAEAIELSEFERRKTNTAFRNPAAFQTSKIPAKYNRRSELTANVTEDESSNTFDFHLTTGKKSP